MKGNKKTVFAVAALAVAATLMLGLWYFNRPQTQEGTKTVVIQVVHGDGTSKVSTCQTDAQLLDELLLEEGLAEGNRGANGLYITTVDGETAQDSLRQFWCITKDGVLTDAASCTPVADGDHFELTLSTY